MCSVCDDFAERFWACRVDDSYGAIAQVVERFHGMEEVGSSNLPGSTQVLPNRESTSPWALAGFVAGEGCFGITTKRPAFANGDPRLRFTFSIGVAERDRGPLEQLRPALGTGSIRRQVPRKAHWQPTVILSVGSLRAHRTFVTPFMHRHLIAGAKRRQFDLWRQAMDSYESFHPTRVGNGPSLCSVDGCDKPVRGRGLCRSHYYEVTGY
jgi:hypothetical protein